VGWQAVLFMIFGSSPTHFSILVGVISTNAAREAVWCAGSGGAADWDARRADLLPSAGER
jgi:hypothetical protein